MPLDADLRDATSSRPPYPHRWTPSSERWTPSDWNAAGRDQIRTLDAIRLERLDGLAKSHRERRDVAAANTIAALARLR